MHNSEVAAAELTRAVRDLGFKGALLNSFQQAGNDGETCLYYDLPQYDAFWAQVAVLDVPVYLHPRNPIPSTSGHPSVGCRRAGPPACLIKACPSGPLRA